MSNYPHKDEEYEIEVEIAFSADNLDAWTFLK